MEFYKNKTVLITGGASGIGKIMGRMVLQSGAKLIFWDVNAALAEETKTELAQYGSVSFYLIDLTDRAQIENVAKETLKEHEFIDVLINNAGIVVGKYFHEHSSIEIGRTMDINANAPMYVTHSFLPEMLKRNTGSICTIASSAGLISNPKMSVYVASKWSALGWSDSLRLEMKLLKKHVYVTTVTPYYINTGMFDGVKSLIPILDPTKVSRKILKGIAKRRVIVSMPFNFHLIRLLQAVLPISVFDVVVGSWMGIYKTMHDFKGRK